MRTRTIVLKLGAAIASLAVMLSLGGPSASASTTVVVSPVSNPSDCGKYTLSDYQDLSVAVGAVTTGTILVCPGDYPAMASAAVISNTSKLTIKRALTGDGSRPVIHVKTSAAVGILVVNSSGLTIDGLILDASNNTVGSYMGMDLIQSSITVRNSTLIGPDQANTYGIKDTVTGSKYLSMTISNTNLYGFALTGIAALGPVKVNISSCILDGTDGGRLTSSGGSVDLDGSASSDPGPTGTITKSKIAHSSEGVILNEVSKVSVTNNVIRDAGIGVSILALGTHHSADNNKVSGNTIIMGPPTVSGFAIIVQFVKGTPYTSLKTSISGNTIFLDPYDTNSFDGVSFQVTGVGSSASVYTGTVSKNIMVGFHPGSGIDIQAGGATVKQSGNDVSP